MIIHSLISHLRRRKQGSGAAAALAPAPNGASVYVAYANATVKQSDGFAFYPLWPSEMVNALDAAADEAEIARSSVRSYGCGWR
jgi:hypothetical protein